MKKFYLFLLSLMIIFMASCNSSKEKTTNKSIDDSTIISSEASEKETTNSETISSFESQSIASSIDASSSESLSLISSETISSSEDTIVESSETIESKESISSIESSESSTNSSDIESSIEATSSSVESSIESESEESSESTIDNSLYLVAFLLDENDVNSPTSWYYQSVVTKNDKLNKPEDPKKESSESYDYEFLGWFDLYTKMQFDFEKDHVSTNVFLVAGFTEVTKKFEVTFNYNYETETLTTVKVAYNDKVAKPENPTKNSTKQYSYTFDCWCTDQELKNEYDFDKEVTGSFTLYARWIETTNSYTVDFSTDGGSNVDSVTVSYGSHISFVSCSKKTTKEYIYTFDGWYTNKELTNAFDFENDTITDNLTLYAKWNLEKVKYKLTYNSNGGSDIDPSMYEWGYHFEEPNEPTKFGYKFLGWYDGDTKWNFILGKMPVSDLTLYAKWEELDITVTYTLRNYDGNVLKTETKTVKYSTNFSEIKYDTENNSLTQTVWTDKDGNVYSDNQKFDTLNLEVFSDIYTRGLGFKAYNGYYAVSSYSTSYTAIYIPMYYKGLPVKMINSSAFKYNSSIEYVYLPDSIIELEDSCFYNCSKLRRVRMSSNLTKLPKEAFASSGIEAIDGKKLKEIGESCFSSCESFTGFDDGSYMGTFVTLERIPSYAFAWCTNLKTYNLSSVKYIDNNAFHCCSNLTSISLYSSVITIGDQAFNNCNLSSFEGPDNLMTLGEEAFGNNSNLSSFTVSDKLVYAGARLVTNSKISFNVEGNNKYIGSKNNSYHLLYDSVNSSSISVNSNCKVIGSGTFRGFTSLKSISLPDTLKGIGNRAFMGCTNLEKIDVSAYGALEVIGDFAFAGTAIKTFNIQDYIRFIGVGIFSSCKNLQSINCLRSSMWYVSANDYDPIDWEPLYLGIDVKKWTTYIDIKNEPTRFLDLLKGQSTRFVYSPLMFS